MKNSAIILLLGLALFASCKKKYTCHCMTSWTGVSHDETVKAKNMHAAQKDCGNRYKNTMDGPDTCYLK